MNVTTEVIDHLTPALAKAVRVLEDPQPVLRKLAERVTIAARGEIDTAGRRSGRPWAPRAPSTLKAITSANRQGFSKVGLPGRASDRMLRSVGTMGGPDSILIFTKDSVTVGSRVRSPRGYPYPVAFVFGTSRQPARQIYALTRQDYRDMLADARGSYKERLIPTGLEYSESEGAAF